MMRQNHRSTPLLLVPICLLMSSGCGVLFGSVKPLTQKSDSYEVADLAAEDKDWVILDRKKLASEEGELPEEVEDDDDRLVQDVSDIAFQSSSTASIISLNSACRDRIAKGKMNLRQFTDSLLLGIGSIENREEENVEVSQVDGLQTQLDGRLNGDDVKLKIVVARSGRCLYDLMYIAQPTAYKTQLATFDRFVKSLKIAESEE